MLWMGDLEQYMDGNFIADAYRKMGENVVSVRVIFDKYSGKEAGYCFVELDDAEAARRSMLNLNGKIIPNSKPPVKFNLSFANNPSAGATEYNLFVNNLPENIGDAELYQLFGRKYVSCRGAKVYRNPDSTSRGMGFVRFADETDQQKALVEMNRHYVHGRPMHLKLAPVRIKPPKYGRGGGHAGNAPAAYDPVGYYSQYQDFYNSNQWQMYDIQQQQQHGGGVGVGTGGNPRYGGQSSTISTPRSTISSNRSTTTDPDLEPYNDTRTIFQQNMDFVDESEEPFRAMEESRWFPTIYSASTVLEDLC